MILIRVMVSLAWAVAGFVGFAFAVGCVLGVVVLAMYFAQYDPPDVVNEVLEIAIPLGAVASAGILFWLGMLQKLPGTRF
jgi:hypothetical protein